jgi:hypothetical protein
MALLADDAADRADQLIVLSERLAALVEDETRRIEARAPTAEAALVEEKERLANAYRLELARIKQDPGLVSAAPKPLLDKLRLATQRLQAALSEHEIAIGAVKFVSEGLVQAMAEEVHRQRQAARPYGASGAPSSGGPDPIAIDRSA